MSGPRESGSNGCLDKETPTCPILRVRRQRTRSKTRPVAPMRRRGVLVGLEGFEVVAAQQRV